MAQKFRTLHGKLDGDDAIGHWFESLASQTACIAHIAAISIPMARTARLRWRHLALAGVRKSLAKNSADMERKLWVDPALQNPTVATGDPTRAISPHAISPHAIARRIAAAEVEISKVRDCISSRAVVGATPSSASSAGCSPRGPRPIRRSASWDRPVLSVARRDERPPDVARPGALALRVGRARSVRPYVLCRAADD